MKWSEALDALGIVVVLPLVLWLGLIVRRRWLARGGATFDCSLRRFAAAAEHPDGIASPRGWMLGLGRYSGEDMEWYRAFSYAPRPRYVVPRSSEMLDRREPTGPETYALLTGHQIIRLEASGGPFELAMNEDALTSFLAWTEAAPPGHPASPADPSVVVADPRVVVADPRVVVADPRLAITTILG